MGFPLCMFVENLCLLDIYFWSTHSRGLVWVYSEFASGVHFTLWSVKQTRLHLTILSPVIPRVYSKYTRSACFQGSSSDRGLLSVSSLVLLWIYSGLILGLLYSSNSEVNPERIPKRNPRFSLSRFSVRLGLIGTVPCIYAWTFFRLVSVPNLLIWHYYEMTPLKDNVISIGRKKS